MFHGAIYKIKVGYFMDHTTSKVVLFLNRLHASGKNKKYLTVVFKQ